MTYLDDRATTARESGAREERARIATMGFFERRARLLKGSALYLSKKSNALFC